MAKAKPITGLDMRAPTGQNARIIARVRLGEMYSWERFVQDPYRVRELHNLRIAAKRLRYTLEIFEDFLPENSQEIVNELEQIQEQLGSVHDSDVMIALLRLCLGSQDSGVLYEQALADATSLTKKAQKQRKTAKGANGKSGTKVLLAPELVRNLIELSHMPDVSERYGLEQLLRLYQQRRETQYHGFREYWYRLQGRDFRREILAMLDA